MSTSATYPRLKDTLNTLRRQWRQTKVLEGILLLVAGAAAVLLVTVAADHLLHLETFGRLLSALFLYGAMLAGLVALVIRRLPQDHSDDFFAALAEEKFPQLQNSFINGLQLGRDSHNGPSLAHQACDGHKPDAQAKGGFSPDLIEAIVADAARLSADLDLVDSVDTKPVKIAALCAGGALLLMGGYALLFLPQFSTSLLRLLLPFADIPPYTSTRVEEKSIRPGNTRIPEGASITVEAHAVGVIPDTAQLLRSSGGPWQSLTMQPDKGNTDTFRVTVSGVYESFRYRVAAGDGRSREYRVDVVKRPAIEKMNLSYTLPDYTGPAKKRIEDTKGDIAAIPGTMVTVEIQATKPLQQAKLKIKDGADIPFDKADNGTWQASFVLWNSELKATPPERGVRVLNAPAQYQVLLTDTEGYDNGDPLWRSINLLRDQPPNVAITTPGKDVQVKPHAKVSLTIEARDDYGVGEVKVLYRVGDAAQVKELVRFTVAKPDEQQTSNKFDWRLDSGTAFKSGEVVQYWAVAVDRNNLTGTPLTLPSPPAAGERVG